MQSVWDVLSERGFIEQASDESEISQQLGASSVTCYIGFDPTASSLHVGSLVPIMALAHMQRHGHRPIVLIGGGTALIGDPSGKTEMRQILSRERIDQNAVCLRRQFEKYLTLGEGGAQMLNNADWLTQLNYISFLRDIGYYFSVNKMLSAESYRMRLERGLNFIEFNYMLLQAYDFLYLFQHNHCVLQMGGNDQWGNMLAGVDLIRRVEGKTAYCLTFPLITTASGGKMGKTEKGTVWLDGDLTSPYEYFQYWINAEDDDVQRFLSFFTFLPMDEIRRVGELKDARLNMAKAVLAFEATRITHGQDAAVAAWKASVAAFGLKPVEAEILPASSIPRESVEQDNSAITRVAVAREKIERGIPAFELFADIQLCASRGEARRLISQGGAYVNDEPISTFDQEINLRFLRDGQIHLRKGKKRHFIVVVK
ncbi:MAG: tyrosine--tRNA ligase [Syntrophales bacterium]|nr:tyrosine--tRNA ligase [Syntrophales bacterium]